MRSIETCVLMLAVVIFACNPAGDDGPGSESSDDGDDPPALTAAQADDCTARAWPCAFDAAVADPRADKDAVRGFLDGCVRDLELADGTSCATACELSPAVVCEEIAIDVAALAREDDSCRSELDDCMTACIDRADSATEGDKQRPFAQCWTLGLTSDCPFYVRDLDGCGGSLTPGSNDACLARCEATHGAWSSDLDETCENQCIF